jgi:hypothetical protein
LVVDDHDIHAILLSARTQEGAILRILPAIQRLGKGRAMGLAAQKSMTGKQREWNPLSSIGSLPWLGIERSTGV